MKIGLGATTCNRPLMLQAFKDSVERYNITPDTLYIHDDTDTRHGVAYSKNMCLYNLQHCDLILLLDDDCLFNSPYALTYIAEAHEMTQQNHFLLMHPDHHDFVKTWKTPELNIELFNDCSGVFMSITKEAFNKVGYLDSRYKRYGYEHAGYSRRIHLTGLNAKPFMCPEGIRDHFRALDFEGNVISSISEQEKNEFSRIGGHNDLIYQDELNNWHTPYRTFNP